MEIILKNKKILFLLSLAIVVIFVIPMIAFLLSGGKEESSDEIVKITPSPFSRQKDHIAPPVYVKPLTEVEIETLIYEVENRKILPEEVSKKREILAQKGADGNIIYITRDVKVVYIKGEDLFHGELLSDDINSGRDDAFSFFIKNGIPKENICDLPLIFLKTAPLEFYKCPYEEIYD